MITPQNDPDGCKAEHFGMSAAVRRSCARRRSPSRARARFWCARCLARSAAAPSVWFIRGRVPGSEHERMRAPHMAGAFPFPVKYGYAIVGRVEAGAAAWRDRIVFCLHPHQSLFTLSEGGAFPYPMVSPRSRRACSQYGDRAQRGVGRGPGPADRIAVVGGGLVGLLVAYLCAPLPDAEVTVMDVSPARAELARALGARFAAPSSAPVNCDRRVSRERARPRGSPPRCGLPVTKRHHRNELVRKRRYRSAARRSIP